MVGADGGRPQEIVPPTVRAERSVAPLLGCNFPSTNQLSTLPSGDEESFSRIGTPVFSLCCARHRSRLMRPKRPQLPRAMNSVGEMRAERSARRDRKKNNV